MSFDTIRLNTIRVAQNLQRRGYQSKQVFGLMAKNSHHIASIIFASLSIGCPINTLSATFSKTKLIHILNITKPTLMFCDVEVYDMVEECLRELMNNAKIFTIGDTNSKGESIENLFAITDCENDFM